MEIAFDCWSGSFLFVNSGAVLRDRFEVPVGSLLVLFIDSDENGLLLLSLDVTRCLGMEVRAFLTSPRL